MWKPYGLAPKEDTCRLTSLHICKVFTYSKEAVFFGNPLILVTLVSRLQVDLDRVENEATPYIMHAVNNMGAIFG